MTFELWDMTSRNVSGFFDTKASALAAVRAAVDDHGRPYAEAFALVSEDTRGRSRLIAEGPHIVDLALRSERQREPAS